jgi:DNA-binding NarL/FixJ family response regulator
MMQEDDSIRVMLVDDQDLVRHGFRAALTSVSDINVVAEASSGPQAVALAKDHRPDVVLMDIRIPKMDGFEVTRRFAELGGPKAPRVVILTSHEQDDYLHDALRAGASGYLLKNVTETNLLNAVRAVAAGQAVICPEMTRRLIDNFEIGLRVRGGANSSILAHLSSRELDVLYGITCGWSNQEIADKLSLADATIKSHVSNLLVKLGVRSRVQAALVAIQEGLKVAEKVEPPLAKDRLPYLQDALQKTAAASGARA